MGTALITGASAGLGVEYAWNLASAGHNLVLVARRKDRLEALAEELRNVAGVRVEVLPCDLADREAMNDVVARLESDVNPVGLLINNAGFGLRSRFLKSDIAEEERALDVLVRAILVLSHAAGRAMVRRGRGAILNVSSIAQGATMGTYAAHKAWVRSFTEVLAGQLKGKGVTATAVLPGLVRTEFHDVAEMRTDMWPEIGWISAEAVVEQSLAAVRRGDVLVTPTFRYKVVNAVLKFAPRRMVRALIYS